MAFHIIVCIKATVTQMKGAQYVRSDDACELNPFDRPALEAAFQLKNKLHGTVTALSMGPGACEFVLFEALALGADRGVLISDPALKDSDTIATSNALAAAIRRLEPFDVVLFGTQTSDSDSGQVGPQTAVLLDLPLVTWAHAIEVRDGRLSVERRADGFCELYEADLPAVLTVHPRTASVKEPALGRIESAFSSGVIERWNLADIGVSPASVGKEGSPTWVRSIREVKKDRKCRLVEGSIEEQASALVGCLADKGVLR